MAQMLNQPAFLIVPSGFSRIRVSFLGRLEITSCACADGTWAAVPSNKATAAHATVLMIGVLRIGILRVGIFPPFQRRASDGIALFFILIGSNANPDTD